MERCSCEVSVSGPAEALAELAALLAVDLPVAGVPVAGLFDNYFHIALLCQLQFPPFVRLRYEALIQVCPMRVLPPVFRPNP